MNFKKGDRIIFVTEGVPKYSGKVFTFDAYHNLVSFPRSLWTKELPVPVPECHFRLATLLERELYEL